MISRRQIIGHHQRQDPPTMPKKQQLSSQQSSSSSSSSAARDARAPIAKASSNTRAGAPPSAAAKQQATNSTAAARKTIAMPQDQQQQQQDSSDGYVPYAEFVGAANEHRNWRQQQQQQQQDDYRQFDPYSVYSEEEDVWYSEERLFEDHLEEIFNKWRLLDDDIWCKLIIMERNRRIGKAYARVPMVTIDGSHTLSYDGYKLALNGFDNPDRDLKTEECRKRIGKGIRIKMDNFGNILIKRLSKSCVYIKEWIQAPDSYVSSATTTTGAMTTKASSSSSSSGPTTTTNTRTMPSRQQLIKNQNALLSNAGGSSNQSTDSSLGSSGLSTGCGSLEQPVSSGGGGGGANSMTTNDSAICDEVLSVGGRLDQDKIYVLFDMKKFQANITQELCRPYPDKRKLEQQCFSIVGLTCDSNDILSLPCWIMVINIVAIEVLNERFPDLMSAGRHQQQYQHHQQVLQRAPNFVSIFERAPSKDRLGLVAKSEEDPYSLPANESSSDMKSSIHDYAGGNRSRYYSGAAGATGGPSRHRADQIYKRGMAAAASGQPSDTHLRLGESAAPMRHKSRSNSNIYGVGIAGRLPASRGQAERGARYNGAGNNQNNNNSSSIYSPGHMLVLPSSDSVPPELPPRDFVAKKVKAKSKSSLAISASHQEHQNNNNNDNDDDDDDEIYSTRPDQMGAAEQTAASSSIHGTKVRKTKRNRFLESLKAPLELAKSASAASSPAQQPQQQHQSDVRAKSSKGSNIVRSFLGVKQKPAKQHDKSAKPAAGKSASGASCLVGADSGEADSVVDSAEELADDQLNQATPAADQRAASASASTSTSGYNDLDIPTPDYETDENIYALNETSSYAPFSPSAAKKTSGGQLVQEIQQQQQQKKKGIKQQNNGSKAAHIKDDLYYSGLRAHVPSQQQQQQLTRSASNAKAASLMDGGAATDAGATGANSSRLGLKQQQPRSSRYASSHLSGSNKAATTRTSGRDSMIYGSTSGLAAAASGGAASSLAAAGSRYRSASMQRYCSRSQVMAAGQQQHRMLHHQQQRQRPMYSDYYDPAGSLEDPYGGSHYGIALQGRRSSSNYLTAAGAALYATGRQDTAAAAAPGYDAGRSSSGIYGNNSNSSSSSDYADWQPQMRKVNSSSYLNSIFKRQSPIEGAAPLAAYGSSSSPYAHHTRNAAPPTLDQPGQRQTKPRGYLASSAANLAGQERAGSRTLAPPSSRSTKQQLKQSQLLLNGQPSPDDGGPAYRSYDSSNDSEPSYTNSSDGLDIYDHIGATRLANNGKLHHNNNNNNNHHHLHHRQFLDMQPIHAPVAHQHLAPEVHVGEWENMYDR